MSATMTTLNRRSFLKSTARIAAASIGIPTLVASYGFAESTHVHIDRQTLRIPRLPQGFQGKRIAFLTDLHHGPFISEDFIAGIVRTTNLLDVDMVVLGGDYSHRDGKYIAPCFDLLKNLSAPMGVHGVLGNHDYAHGLAETREGFRRAKITELTNRHITLTQRGEKLILAGVDDYWHGEVRVNKALEGVTVNDAVILLSHNPDVAETMSDRRVGLMLSGHTHGGQIAIPGYGAPMIPSRYGRKYAHGLVEAPTTNVFISAGTGMSILPVRANCRPELTVIELA
jgi:uncharacterized protein